MNKVIVVESLSKNYMIKREKKKALRDCSFVVEKGTSVGFVGLNGAGKSTLIKLLVGIMQPSSGNILVLGENPFANRKRLMKNVGVLFGQRSNLVYDLPVKDSFSLLKTIYSLSEDEYVKQMNFLKQYIDIEELMNIPVRQMSLGQRMRCEVASVLLHNPQLVFFDEAFLGIDFKSKIMIRKLIEAMRRKNGTTFVITSHDIRDIERMCDDVIILNEGTIIAHDNIFNIESRSKWVHLEISFYDEINFEDMTTIGETIDVEEINKERNSIIVKVERGLYSSIIESFYKKYDIKSYEVSDYRLEDIIACIYEETKDCNVEIC